MNEEIVVKFGGDTRPLARAMRSLNTMVTDAGKRIKSSMIDIKSSIVSNLTGFGATIASGLTIGALVAGIRSIKEYGARLQDLKETVGQTTDFIQGFSSLVAQSGGSAQVAEKGLEKLNLIIGKAREGVTSAVDAFNKYEISLTRVNGTAKTGEEIIKDIADRLTETEDPARRAAIAADFFGDKAGPKLVEALAKGRKGIEEFINAADKMSPDDIKALDDYSDSIEELQRRAKVQGGTILGFFAKLGEATNGLGSIRGIAKTFLGPSVLDVIDAAKVAGELSVKGDKSVPLSKAGPRGTNTIRDFKEIQRLQEQLDSEIKKSQTAGLTAEKELSERVATRLELKREIESAEEGSSKKLEKKIELEKNEQQILRLNKSIEESRLKTKNQQLQTHYQLMSAEADMFRNRRLLSETRGDRSRFTVGELVDSAKDRFAHGSRLRPAESGAVKIFNLEERARIARFFGKDAFADTLTNRALEMRKSMSGVLTSSEADPLRSLQETSAKSSERLDQLLNLAAGKGLNTNIMEVD